MTLFASLLYAVVSFSPAATTATSLTCETTPYTAEAQLGFTRSLLDDAEYYRVVGEGSRYLYFYAPCGGENIARLYVGLAYQRAKQWEKATEVFRSMSNRATGATGAYAQLALADTLFRQERFEAAATSYRLFAQTTPDVELAGYAHYREGFSHFLNRNPTAARDAFSAVSPDAREYRYAAPMSDAVLGLYDVPSKSPLAAGIMSGVLPGLGQVYTGRWVDGVISFIVNAGFIYGTYEAFNHDLPVVGILIGLFEVGWYTGNIFSAVNYAQRFNERAVEGYQRELMLKELVERDWAAESVGETRYLRFGLDF